MSKAYIRSLFEIYSRNLSIVRKGIPRIRLQPDVDNIFICPICMNKLFTQDAIDADELSLEHVPPRALGGPIRTITCKVCNNTSGSKLEGHLAKQVRFLEFWLNDSSSQSQDIKYSLDGDKPLPATFNKLIDGTFELWGQPGRTNPADLDKINKLLQGGEKKPLKVNLFFGPYKKTHSDAALLRIAYLYAFSVLGYSFILPNIPIQNIRSQFLNPTVGILPISGIIYDHEKQIPDGALGVNLILEPKDLQSFFVVFDLMPPQGTRLRYGVFLPGPSSPGALIYKHLVEYQGKSLNPNMIHISEEENFNDYPFIALDIWNNWRQSKE